MRAARLLSIVFELESRPGVTAAVLAQELGVSVRTVYRDIAALQVAGVPVYGTSGRSGGLRLVDGYRSNAAAVRAGEAAALLAGVVPNAAAQLGLGDDAERAVRKVMSQSGGTSGAGQILVDPVGWYRSPDEVPHLALVAEAMRTGTALAIRYSRWAEPNEVRRQIAPHGLVLKAGAWYVVARTGRGMRTYRVNQIRSARPTGTTFEPDADFDLAAVWTSFVVSFTDRLHVVDVVASVSEGTSASIRREGDPVMIAALDSASPSAGRPGWVDATLPYESIDHAAGDLMRHGAGVEVTAPHELRERIRDRALDLVNRYR